MEKQENKCTYCKKDDNRECYPVFDIFDDKYNINQCNNCNAFFLAPPPTQAQLSRAYDSSYYGEQEEKFVVPLAEKMLDIFRKIRAKRVSAYLKDDAKILDIGCGNGRFLLFLLRHGNYKLFGTEMGGGSAMRAASIPQINLKIGKLEHDYFSPETFDAITLFHVFEHLTEPVETLQIISKIIKKGGIAVFSFPNIASNQSRWFKGKWLHLDPPRHLFYFTPKDFKRIIREYGFEVISERHSSTEQNPFGMVQSLLNKWSSKRELLFENMKGNESYVKDFPKSKLMLHKLFFYTSFGLFIVTDWFAAMAKKGATVEFVVKKVNHRSDGKVGG